MTHTAAAELALSTPASSLNQDDLVSFETLAELAHSRAGLVLSKDKAPMVLARVGKRMRAIGVATLGEYCHYVLQPDSEPERQELIFTLTTNVTSFMREEHHFRTIQQVVVPQIERAARQGEKVRLWSAGCSSGQEPYSLAMTILDGIPNAAELDIKILATDIDANILTQARAATYSEQQISGLDAKLRQKYVRPSSSATPSLTQYSITEEVKRLVSFRELNLLGDWPMKKKFHLVMCRNVVIYFDRETQRNLWSKFSSALVPQGFLFLGHSERLDTSEFTEFQASGTTTYQLTAK